MDRPIDLTAVAKQISALDGWRVDLEDAPPRCEWMALEAFRGDDYISVWEDGDVLIGNWDGRANALLPVLQIVEAARQEAGGD